MSDDATTWTEALQQIRKDKWRAALVAAHGNITRAAAALGIHRVHGAKLTRKFKLAELARELRVARAVPAVGRPPNRPTRRGK